MSRATGRGAFAPPWAPFAPAALPPPPPDAGGGGVVPAVGIAPEDLRPPAAGIEPVDFRAEAGGGVIMRRFVPDL
ncbi:MAG: hypothetical protein KDB32_08960 [Planctomycetes bacterium]|nr:hypothetical protein [Planctomycetota bacterium]